MPVSKDTTTDTQVSEVMPLFPPTLGKKLIRENNKAYRIDTTYLDHLEEYLGTRNPDFLVKAIRQCPDLLKGKGRNLDVEEYLIGKGDKTIKPEIYITDSTIVGETIRWWQHLNQWMGNEDEYKPAKKLLLKIMRPFQILLREEIIIERIGDGFIHVIEKEEGKHPYLTYESAIDYIQYYEKIKEVFKARKKRYYKIETQPKFLKNVSDQSLKVRALAYEARKRTDLVIANIRKIIKNALGDKISEMEVKSFELADVNTITASYIAWKHEAGCSVCKKTISRRKRKAKDENRMYKVGYKTFQRRYKEAKKELEITK